MSLEKQKNISEQLLAGNFGKSSHPLHALSDPIVETPMVLTLEQIKSYEFNPRTIINPKYDEIKASIRTRGLEQPLVVTRRPDENFYTIYNGGNTRLTILNELFSETKEIRFFKLKCLFKPWTTEIAALTGHLTENELRGQIIFIERALAVMKAKELYEKDGEIITQKGLADRLTQSGYVIKQSIVSVIEFAVSDLLPTIPDIMYSGFSLRSTRQLLNLRNISKSVTKRYEKKIEHRFDVKTIFRKTLQQFNSDSTETFNFKRFKDELISKMSAIFGCDHNMILLEFEEKESRQKLLETPPRNDIGDIEFDEKQLLENNLKKLDKPLIQLDEDAILSHPLLNNNQTSQITAPNLPQASAPDFIDDAPSIEMNVESHLAHEPFDILNPLNDQKDTTTRLLAINSQLDEWTENENIDEIENDVLNIPSNVNTSFQLQKEIGRLVLLLAKEVDVEVV